MDSKMPQPPNWGGYYGRLFSRRVDLVGDYAGSEPFLVEGDSLLLECFSDPMLDFQDGFQMLHAVWLVEQFLHGLQRRNCNFHLAFFDDREHLSIPSHASDAEESKYRLARAVIVRHLQVNFVRNSSPINLFVFPSLNSKAFSTALAANAYMFVMMNDGAAEICDCDPHRQSKSELRLDICSLIDRGYSVALINGLEWRDTKVIAAVIEGVAKRGKVVSRASKVLPKDELAADLAANVFSHELCEVFTKHNELAEQKLSERLYLVIAAAASLVSEAELDSSQISSFILHSILQTQLPLHSRSFTSFQPTAASKYAIQRFSNVSLNILKSPLWQKFAHETQISCDVADLVDGRLYGAVLAKKVPPPQLDKEFTRIITSMINLDSAKFSEEVTRRDAEQQLGPGQALPGLSKTDRKVLPFSTQAFDKHLAPVKLNADSEATQRMDSNNSRAFRELTHWHNAKIPLNPKVAVAAKGRPDFYARRRDQRFMAEMTAYAISLTNAVGKALDPETIITQDGQSNPSHVNKQQWSGQVNKKGGNKEKQARDDKRIAEQEKKGATNNQKVFDAWHVFCQNIQKEPRPDIRYTKALDHLTSLHAGKQDVVGSEIQLYALSCLLELWEASLSKDSKSPDYSLAAKVWDSVARLVVMSGISKTMEEKLQQTVDSLGLPFSVSTAQVPDRKLPFDFTQQRRTILRIATPSKEFQLTQCGPYFDRKLDSAPDDRVPFSPDGWQRKVLDAIDAEKSLFVVAPTSAGKTFISFYAMKKVLKGSNEGILVYIAPTKALVNQIAAEVQARFSKTYKHAGKSVWAIHTRDYRVNNATGCQVLVTVPHILQIMLLSPSNANSWSSRIKRIIFDEVHCIGQAEDGIIWEQLLLLAPCPIIALSATVGNPEEFRSWLASAQKAAGNDLVMVHHPHRYSDLRKFVYVPPKDIEFARLAKAQIIPRVGLGEGEQVKFVHPVASLLNRSRGMPEDFSLEARDCFTLWKTMKAHENKSYKVPDSLDPAQALPSVIAQADIIDWCQLLKELLGQWMVDQSSPFDAVVLELGRDLHALEAENDTGLDQAGLRKTITPLLCHLHAQSALPAILFNYDRSNCERLCRTVLNDLKEAEQNWKDTDPSWERKMAGWEEWKKINSKGPPKKSAGKKTGGVQEEGMSRADMKVEAAATEPNSWKSFDPNAPIDGFHFMDRTKLSQEEFEVYAKPLRWRHLDEWLIEALGRGVAIHHAGMNRKYRYAVELLFRKGFLRVVIATGTLALGINMPCKTVVFCGDSIFLTALNFRQAAGRAGRRGFDLLGNVVFHGIPISKVYRLLSSRLPELTGHFPITTTLVLRLSTLLAESNQSAFAVGAVDALLSQPRLYLGGAENRMTVLHHLRFSLEYLRRQHLLSHSGQPLNFAGCVSHLYYTEPANFAFHALLKDGYFHRLCVGIRRHPEANERVCHTLMLVLAHLFGRRYCRHVDREFIEEVVKNSPSLVFLPALPAEAAGVLEAHNGETLDIFKAYVRTYVAQHLSRDADNVLPLTGMRFGDDNGGSGLSSPNVSAAAHSSIIRSAFVALSGHNDDNITSISDLCATVRSGVYLEEAVIPYIPLTSSSPTGEAEAASRGKAALPLNAYLLDFLKHGNVRALAAANGVRRGDVWFVLNDFSMVLATIVTSLEGFLRGDPLYDADGAIGEGDAHDALVEYGLADREDTTEADAGKKADKAAAPLLLPVQEKKGKKKAVAENWDDDDDGDDGEDDDGGDGPGANGLAAGFPNGDWDGAAAPAWEDDGNGSLLDVLQAFKLLSEDFNSKFKTMWA